MCGSCRAMRSATRWASPHSTTRSTSGSRRRKSTTISRASGSSSTTRTVAVVKPWLSRVRAARWAAESRPRRCRRRSFHVEPRPVVETPRRARVLPSPVPACGHREPGGRHSPIADLHVQQAVIDASAGRAGSARFRQSRKQRVFTSGWSRKVHTRIRRRRAEVSGRRGDPRGGSAAVDARLAKSISAPSVTTCSPARSSVVRINSLSPISMSSACRAAAADQRRDRIERVEQEWAGISSRSASSCAHASNLGCESRSSGRTVRRRQGGPAASSVVDEQVDDEQRPELSNQGLPKAVADRRHERLNQAVSCEMAPMWVAIMSRPMATGSARDVAGGETPCVVDGQTEHCGRAGPRTPAGELPDENSHRGIRGRASTGRSAPKSSAPRSPRPQHRSRGSSGSESGRRPDSNQSR